MEPIEVTPEKAQETMWFIVWGTPLVLGLGACAALLLAVNALVAALVLVGLLIIMAPVGLWIPAFWKSLQYVIDIDSVRMRKGVFWKKHVTVLYSKITNVDVTQGPLQRVFDIGTVHVQTAGAGGLEGAGAELTMLGVRDLNGLRNTILERVSRDVVSASTLSAFTLC